MSSIDPHTGDNIEFLHNHHTVTWRDDQPTSLIAHQTDFGFLPELMATSASFYYPSGGSDQQCTSSRGGVQCQFFKIPQGFGRRVFDEEDVTVLLHFQDIRENNSLPLSYFIDVGSLFITDPKVTPKSVFIAAMEVGSSQATTAFTYSMPDNKAGVQFISYYFPVRSEIVGLRMHFHSWEGDEVWLVRGTQEDLGIAKSMQRPIIHSAGNQPPDAKPVLMSMDEMNDMKLAMTNSLKMRGVAVAEKLISRVSERNKTLYVPFDGYEAWSKHYPLVPQLLCRYFGHDDMLSMEDIQHKRDRVRKLFVDKFGESVLGNKRRRDRSLRTSKKIDSRTSKKIDRSHYSDWVARLRAQNIKDGIDFSPEITRVLNTPEMQVHNLLIGSLVLYLS